MNTHPCAFLAKIFAPVQGIICNESHAVLSSYATHSFSLFNSLFSYAKTFLAKKQTKKSLETPGLFFSFPPSQVVAGRADGDICSTSKERDIFTSPTHVSLKQPKSLFCESYFPPAEGELTLIKICFFPQLQL